MRSARSWSCHGSTRAPTTGLDVVRFSDLRVNSRPPGAARLAHIWMSAAHAIFGPTEALHYQRLAVREDLAAYLFDARLASWTATTPARTVKAGVLSFDRAVQENVVGLRAYHWSASVRPAIGRLLDGLELLRGSLVGTFSSPDWSLSEIRDDLGRSRVGEAGFAVKERLHIGITDQSVLTIADYVKTHSH